MINSNTKLGLTTKEFIAIIIWIASLIGMYYTMKTKVDTALEKSIAVEQQLKENNLGVINYRLDELSKQLDKIYQAVK